MIALVLFCSAFAVAMFCLLKSFFFSSLDLHDSRIMNGDDDLTISQIFQALLQLLQNEGIVTAVIDFLHYSLLFVDRYRARSMDINDRVPFHGVF